MVLSVKWTPEAKYQFREILDYWENRNGSSIYSNRLIDLFDQSIRRLCNFPEIGRLTNNQKIMLKIVKDYFLYYSYDDTQLTILGVSDMRRDPDYIRSFID